MKIVVIGATGNVGSAAVDALQKKHEIIAVSRSTTPSVDLTDVDSIEQLFAEIGEVDAVVSAFGAVPFKPLSELGREDYQQAFTGKALSQLDLVRIALPHVKDGGSITLTTGILAREAIPTGAAASMANGAVESFVMAAAGEMPRGIRINAVSPNVLEDAPAYHDAFPGFDPVSSRLVGLGFMRSVDGILSGETITVG